MQKYKVQLSFKEPLLGTVPKNKDIYTDFIASKAPTPEHGDEEADTVPESDEKGCTGFHLLPDGRPFIYDYMIKGFFKDACSMLSRVSGKKEEGKERVAKNNSSKLTAFKKMIDGLVFIDPRQIPIELIGDMGVLGRPLRIPSRKGERVALAKSDTVPAGSKIEFTVKILGEVGAPLLEEWLEYGSLRGLGQWRNAGYGSFDYKIEEA